MIFNIARIELRRLFFSPVAWVILIIFSVQTGLSFGDIIERIVGYHNFGNRLIDQTFFLFARVGENEGLLKQAQSYLFLYVPFLTMGLISQEYNVGSIKLLLSSSVNSTQIAFGKFLAMMLYGLLLMSVLVLYFFAGSAMITSLSFPFFLSGLTGLYLLYCTYCAIGLLMSSLSQSQPIAAISTLILLFGLTYLNRIGQGFYLMRKLTEVLLISGRATHMLDGLIITGDIFYFILFICFFIWSTILKLQGDQQSATWLTKAVKYVLVTCLIFFLISISNLPRLQGYIDLTPNKTQTLSANSLSILTKIKPPLVVHTYVNILGPYAEKGYPKNWLENRELFALFRRFLPEIKTDYTFYYDTSRSPIFSQFKGKSLRQIAIKVAYADGVDFQKLLTPAEIKRKVNLDGEDGQLVRQIEANGKIARLREFDDVPPNDLPGEADITNSLKQLIVPAPKVIFLTDNQARSSERFGDRNYYYSTIEPGIRGALINQGYDVKSMPLDSLDDPQNIAVIVLADPTTALTNKQIGVIKRYLDSGGNMFLCGEPGRQNILNPILEKLGIKLTEQVLVQPDERYPKDLVLANFCQASESLSPQFARFHIDSSIVTMPGTAALEFNLNSPYKILPVLQSNVNKAAVAVALSKNPAISDQRIVVTGDADFMTEKEINSSINNVNTDFYIGVFQWLCYGKYPVDTSHPITVNALKMNQSGVYLFNVLGLGVLPLTLLIVGAALLVKRNRK